MKIVPDRINNKVVLSFPEKAITNEINKIITLTALQPSTIRSVNLSLYQTSK